MLKNYPAVLSFEDLLVSIAKLHCVHVLVYDVMCITWHLVLLFRWIHSPQVFGVWCSTVWLLVVFY